MLLFDYIIPNDNANQSIFIQLYNTKKNAHDAGEAHTINGVDSNGPGVSVILRIREFRELSTIYTSKRIN